MNRVRAFTAAVVVSGVLFGDTAAADRPITSEQSGFAVSCRAETEHGTVIAEAVAGPDGAGFIGVWAPGADPSVDTPVLSTLAELPVSKDGDRVTSFGPIHHTASGEQAGKTSFTIDTVVAETSRVNETEHEGNRTAKVRGMRHTLAGTGFATLPGFDVVFESCAGSWSQLELWDSQPHAIQGSGRVAIIECVAVNEEGYRLELYGDDLNLSADVYAPGSDQMVVWAFGHDDYGTMLDINGLHAGLRTHDAVTAEYLGDTVDDVTTTSLGRPRTIEQRFMNGRQVLRVEDADVDGGLVFPNGLAFSLDECQISEFDSRLHVSFPPARGSVGPVPANDGVDGAAALRVGGRAVQQQTGGTVYDAEVPSSCEGKGEDYGPVGKTVWYSVVGTGGSITLDTAGSDFDTVLAVYRSVGGALVEVACGDDTPAHRFADTPQARLTLATEPGVRYLVQAGGFNGEYGRLALTAS